PREDGDRLAPHLPHGTLPAALEPDVAGVAGALVPDPDAPGRAAELDRAVGARLAVLGPAAAPADGARSARRAVAVLRLALDGGLDEKDSAGLVRADEHLAALLLHADATLAAELARRRLAPLDGLAPAVRARQEATLRAWLDHQGNVPAAARALHVHPQTVRYRLAQLREAFGPALEDPRARFELLLALHGSYK
ncbi:MAG TPA: helix-turn-helix domain-containing protein, partial [Solirubrobacteraceae bacterium]